MAIIMPYRHYHADMGGYIWGVCYLFIWLRQKEGGGESVILPFKNTDLGTCIMRHGGLNKPGLRPCIM